MGEMLDTYKAYVASVVANVKTQVGQETDGLMSKIKKQLETLQSALVNALEGLSGIENSLPEKTVEKFNDALSSLEDVLKTVKEAALLANVGTVKDTLQILQQKYVSLTSSLDILMQEMNEKVQEKGYWLAVTAEMEKLKVLIKSAGVDRLKKINEDYGPIAKEKALLAKDKALTWGAKIDKKASLAEMLVKVLTFAKSTDATYTKGFFNEKLVLPAAELGEKMDQKYTGGKVVETIVNTKNEYMEVKKAL